MHARHIVLSLILAAGLTTPIYAFGGAACQAAAEAASPTTAAKPATVQLAILLDTSGSMDGLIEQAKAQLWTIVNQFATSKHRGLRPKLQVALYHYGNDTIDANEQHVQMLLPLTDDLDAVSEKLFSLRTNGGSEFCGAAIDKATRELAWSADANDLKIIVIAGNEPFTQGNTDYHNAVPAAVKKNIIINTIFCGNKSEGENTNWKDGAVLGEGAFSFIDQNSSAPPIATPHDSSLSALGVRLNDTYMAFGAKAEEGQARQVMQDANAASVAPAATAARAVSKASALYSNASWDLVDAVEQKKVALKDVEKKDLPKEMQSMTLEEREAHITKLSDQRKALQKEIGELEVKRQAFIADERAKQSGAVASTLGDALLAAVREQATKKGYTFDAPAKPDVETPDRSGETSDKGAGKNAAEATKK